MNYKLGTELAHGGKAAHVRFCELHSDQLIGDLGRPRRDVMQTVVAHEGLLWLGLRITAHQYNTNDVNSFRQNSYLDGCALSPTNPTMLNCYSRKLTMVATFASTHFPSPLRPSEAQFCFKI